MQIKYEVREYIEENCFDRHVRYGIYDVKANDTRFCDDPYNGVIFLFDNEIYAHVVCYFLNKDQQN